MNQKTDERAFRVYTMTLLCDTQNRIRFMLSVVVWLSLPGPLASVMPQSPTGSVRGTIRLIQNDQTIALAGARVEVSSVSNDQDAHNAVTDKTGQYTLDLPEGIYKMHFFWQDGDCSTVRRAPFRLSTGEHLTFDFLIMHCPIADVKAEVPYEEGNKGGFKSMNVPFRKQGRRYLEQLIPAAPGHWPEIIVSFGKYDNQGDEIRYFPMHQALGNIPASTAPLLLSLPVTVTVDRYTLQALEVILDSNAMVFTAKGNVFVSDGQSSRIGNYATLSFEAGRPRLEMEH